MAERKRNLVVRLDEQELAMVRALAEAQDLPMTMFIRRLLRAAYVERFGVTLPPPPAK
jgi:predicted DNA binding CopG/RHH family protein